MAEPREPKVVENELRDLRKVIEIHEELLRKFPNDKVIKLSLEQYLFREQELLRELEEAKRYTQEHKGFT